LVEAGTKPLHGSVGHSNGNALAETVNNLYRTEVLRRRRPKKPLKAVQLATLEWVD
jgi:putative transposase